MELNSSLFIHVPPSKIKSQPQNLTVSIFGYDFHRRIFPVIHSHTFSPFRVIVTSFSLNLRATKLLSSWKGGRENELRWGPEIKFYLQTSELQRWPKQRHVSTASKHLIFSQLLPLNPLILNCNSYLLHRAELGQNFTHFAGIYNEIYLFFSAC
jgi:hypothetical protein